MDHGHVRTSRVKENEEVPYVSLNISFGLIYNYVSFGVGKTKNKISLICISGQGSRCHAVYKQAACKSQAIRLI